MQKDMHYFGTYSMARAAGLKPEICQTIATAAEFVDDNGEEVKLPFEDGGRLDFVPTAHHMLDVKNIEDRDQRLVWLPFHFIPGNKGETVSERLVCRKDSQVAREMVEHNLRKAGEDNSFGQHLAGITAHTYADTFSHYGFSGVSSRQNAIDFSSLELLNLEPEIEDHIASQTKKFMDKYYDEATLTNFRDAVLNSLTIVWANGEFEGGLYGPLDDLEAAGNWWVPAGRFHRDVEAMVGSFGAVCVESSNGGAGACPAPAP